MEKVLQEFRIIETDDGFRIEIKGDKEELREFVMNLDPRRWMHRGPEHGPGPFGPPWMWRGPRMRARGPFGWGPWAAWEDDDAMDEEGFDEDAGWPRKGKRRGRGRGPRRHHEHHGHHDRDHEEDMEG